MSEAIENTKIDAGTREVGSSWWSSREIITFALGLVVYALIIWGAVRFDDDLGGFAFIVYVVVFLFPTLLLFDKRVFSGFSHDIDRAHLPPKKVQKSNVDPSRSQVRSMEAFQELIVNPSVWKPLGEFTSRVRNELTSSGAKIYLRSTEGDVVLVSIQGLESDNIKIGKSFAIDPTQNGRGMTATVVASRSPLVVADYKHWENAIKDLRKEFTSVLEVPIFISEEVVGAVAVFDKEKRYLPKDVTKLSNLADSFSLSLHQYILVRENEIIRRHRINLIRAARELVSPTSPSFSITTTIYRALAKVIDFDRATVQIISGDSRRLMLPVSPGTPIDERLHTTVSSSQLISWVVSQREPLMIPDTAQNSHWEKREPVTKVASWMAIPLLYEDKAIGVITVDSYEKNKYSYQLKDTIKLFSILASQFYIENMRGKNRYVEKEILRAIEGARTTQELFDTVTKSLVKEIECSRCKIFLPRLVAGGSIELYPVASFVKDRQVQSQDRNFAYGEGVAGWVFQSGRSARIGDLDNEPRYSPPAKGYYKAGSILSVPLKVQDVPVGVISLDHDQKGWFSVNDQAVVESMSMKLSDTLERVRSFEHLLSLSTQILYSRDEGEILKETVKGAVKMTSGHASAIYLISEDESRIVGKPIKFPESLELPPPRMDEGVTQKIIETRQYLPIPDISNTSENVQKSALRLGIRSKIGFPIIIDNKVRAVLYVFVYGDHAHDYSTNDVSVLEFLTLLVALKVGYLRSREEIPHDEVESVLIQASRLGLHEVLENQTRWN